MESNLSPNERLRAMTREMFDCASARDWDQLTALEQSRQPLFNQVFAQGIVGNVELAREILALDEKTKALAEAQLPLLQKEILNMQNSGKAKNAYQVVQDSISDIK